MRSCDQDMQISSTRWLKSKFVYFAPADVLIPRVDRQCIMRFCEALTSGGVNTELISLNVGLEFDEPSRSQDLFDVYGIKTPFIVKILPSTLRQTGPDIAATLHRFISYSVYTLWQALFVRSISSHDITIYYFKNYLYGLTFLLLKRIFRSKLMLLLEVHTPPRHPVGSLVLKRVDGVISVSHKMAEELRTQLGIDNRRILVAHQGVDLDYIESVRLTKEEARDRLQLPENKKLAVYTGKVYRGYKEIEFILEAAKLLPEDVLFVIVGGRADQVDYYRKRTQQDRIQNVLFVGFVPPSDVFYYQFAADVLIMYYPTGLPINDYRASPGKLFEYMASGVPIVSADYAALREVLTDQSAVFTEPDRPDSLAGAIQQVLSDPELGQTLAAQAYRIVQQYTWKKRAGRILEFIEALREEQT